MSAKDTRHTVLIVDDEEDIRLVLEDILSVRYHVLSASDGIEALEQIAKHANTIELVMTDLRMPRLDGMGLVQRLRQQYPEIGIMMISAHGTITEAVNAMQNGVFDYITKPLPADLDELYAKCERYFSMRRLQLQQEKLQRKIVELSCFPRSNPHYVARVIPDGDRVLLAPGNDHTSAFFAQAAGTDSGPDGRFELSQGKLAQLFPDDFRQRLTDVIGTDQVVEIDRVEANKSYYRHTYTPFVDNPNEIFVNITDVTRQERAEQVLADEVQSHYHFEEIIGGSTSLRQVLDQVELVAQTDTSVLIQGETGTGKELICRAIHHASPRRDAPLVKLNCAAIPSGLIESELFGHEKGSFTGAINQKRGRFELAHEATIFLDEIGDIPLETQPKLLRLLQEQEFERVGGAQTIKVDVRVITATHRDLAAMVRQGQFREDLFYRLNVFPLQLPALRQRREDIAALAKYFAHRLCVRFGRSPCEIAAAALARLEQYAWPGNVRELENIIERAVILAGAKAISAEHVQVGAAPPPPQETTTDQPILPLQEIERRHIAAALEAAGGKISGKNGAAEMLGLKPTTLESRIKKLGIAT
jgi:DNA-binding NtrC family response regulator